MPLPKSGPYGGTVYQCDGYGCQCEFSVPTVTNDPAAIRHELTDGWMLRWTAAHWELFCPDCSPTRIRASKE
jgi:hypothetical protein